MVYRSPKLTQETTVPPEALVGALVPVAVPVAVPVLVLVLVLVLVPVPALVAAPSEGKWG